MSIIESVWPEAVPHQQPIPSRPAPPPASYWRSSKKSIEEAKRENRERRQGLTAPTEEAPDAD